MLRNRLVKAAMSDSLGNGVGEPTDDQIAMYRRWSDGGIAASIIGEVQVVPTFPEKPGNLVLRHDQDLEAFRRLAAAGTPDDSHIWPQLGHAGALADPSISQPAGPSALRIGDWSCEELPPSALDSLPDDYASAAGLARSVGFTGVQIHAGHGFLLSQFLSPLFNRRTDRYGGSIAARSQLLLDVVTRVRREVGRQFAITVKINSSDQLDDGLSEEDALVVVERLADAGVDLIDISGGTYFPGAASSSDRRSDGPYFVDFARRARAVADVPLMTTGGFKTRHAASSAVADGSVDLVGLARPLALDPELPMKWLGERSSDPVFPRFESPPAGGITAWYTMRLTALAQGVEDTFERSLDEAVRQYESRDRERSIRWRTRFGSSLGND